MTKLLTMTTTHKFPIQELGRIYVNSTPVSLLYCRGLVWVGLADGSLTVYERGLGGEWNTSEEVRVSTADPVSALVVGRNLIYAAAGRQVAVIDPENGGGQPDHVLTMDHAGVPETSRVTYLAYACSCLWVAMSNTTAIALYNVETLTYMHSVDIADSLSDMVSQEGGGTLSPNLQLTALTVSGGILWVGTNQGWKIISYSHCQEFCQQASS